MPIIESLLLAETLEPLDSSVAPATQTKKLVVLLKQLDIAALLANSLALARQLDATGAVKDASLLYLALLLKRQTAPFKALRCLS
jgi:hypothetical protein